MQRGKEEENREELNDFRGNVEAPAGLKGVKKQQGETSLSVCGQAVTEASCWMVKVSERPPERQRHKHVE